MEKLIELATPKGTLMPKSTTHPTSKNLSSSKLSSSSTLDAVVKKPATKSTTTTTATTTDPQPQSSSPPPSKTMSPKVTPANPIKGPSKQDLTRHQIHNDADLIDIPSSILSTLQESADSLSKKAAAKYGY